MLARRRGSRRTSRGRRGRGRGRAGRRTRRGSAGRPRRTPRPPRAAARSPRAASPKTSGKPPARSSAPQSGRQRLVAQRVEAGELGAGGREQLEVLRVVKGEGGAAGDRDPRAAGGLGRRARRSSAGPGASAGAARARARSRPATSASRSTAARERGERRAARGSRSPAGTRPRWRSGATSASSRRRAPSTGTPSGSIASRSSCSWWSEPTRLRITPATLTSRVEGRVAVDDRGDRAGHRRRVDDEQHRRVEELRDVRGGGELAAARGAVEEAHDALDDGDVRARARRGGTAARSAPGR